MSAWYPAEWEYIPVTADMILALVQSITLHIVILLNDKDLDEQGSISVTL